MAIEVNPPGVRPAPYRGGVSEFIVRMASRHPPARAWARVWDLDRHTQVIPLTTVTPDPPDTALAEGVGFTGRTSLGPLAFDDMMRVTRWRPPTRAEGGHAVVVKTGRLLGGRIEVAVAPASGGSVLTWRQSVELPWLPSSLSWVEGLAARGAAPGYRAVLRRLLS